MTNQKVLRKELRMLRGSLSEIQQHQAQKKIAAIVSVLPEFLASSHIAVYYANDGEIDPLDIVKEAWEQGKACYLPVVGQSKESAMCFFSYDPETLMEKNKYGILQPVLAKACARRAEDLDLVLLPLTGFDDKGSRVGMGGGYYDRTFAFKKDTMKHCKPLLIGLAHACQKVKSLPVNNWDIPLAGVATDEVFYRCSLSV